MDYDFTTNSPAGTIELGKKIGQCLKGGEIIALVGPLGSGKTHLIKGIAAGAGAQDPQHVNSPTFVIVNEYEARFHIYHIDAYRIDSPSDFDSLGFDDYCCPDSVVLIEWADKVSTQLTGIDLINIRLEHEGQKSRNIKILSAPDHLEL